MAQGQVQSREIEPESLVQSRPLDAKKSLRSKKMQQINIKKIRYTDDNINMINITRRWTQDDEQELQAKRDLTCFWAHVGP